jgi:transcriptional regulator GlxA family with amidase domain
MAYLLSEGTYFNQMKIGIVAYQNCTTSMLTGMMDILSLANTQASKTKLLFDITLISGQDAPVSSFNNFPITCGSSIDSKKTYDMIYVPGFLDDPLQMLGREKKIIHWLWSQYANGTKISAACNGNLLVAEAGILNGKHATTHWSLIDFFSRRYPLVNLQPEKIVIDEGDVISAAGVTAYMNLAMHLVAKHGSPEIASYCSKVFLVDSGRKVQTPYLIYSTPRNHGDKEIVKIQDWIESHFTDQLSVDSIFQESAMGRRTLIRRFKKATGDTPLEYLQRIRIENAKRFLETTNKTFSEITWDVGYNDISSFQRLFKTHTRLTPKEYRNKFTLIHSN